MLFFFSVTLTFDCRSSFRDPCFLQRAGEPIFSISLLPWNHIFPLLFLFSSLVWNWQSSVGRNVSAHIVTHQSESWNTWIGIWRQFCCWPVNQICSDHTCTVLMNQTVAYLHWSEYSWQDRQYEALCGYRGVKSDQLSQVTSGEVTSGEGTSGQVTSGQVTSGEAKHWQNW